jgi:hypothetical protein
MTTEAAGARGTGMKSRDTGSVGQLRNPSGFRFDRFMHMQEIAGELLRFAP